MNTVTINSHSGLLTLFLATWTTAAMQSECELILLQVVVCSVGQQEETCKYSLPILLKQLDMVVFIIRFYWASASARGHLYSAGAAKCHIQSLHFVFKRS